MNIPTVIRVKAKQYVPRKGKVPGLIVISSDRSGRFWSSCVPVVGDIDVSR